ncbi:MAG: DUF4097 family beta strand repeat-containing protein [Acidobacteria bacterium]|nr:DUF4097 family beta strand repeat-containing protein [Acidobacteriota bacterium]
MLARTLKTWCLCVAAGAMVCGAATVDRSFNESFPVAPGVRLELIHGDGDVDIEAWDNDRIDISVRYRVVSRGWGGVRDFEVDFDRAGDLITVEGREISSGFSVNFGQTHEYRYTVKAPPYVALELRGDDGDVEVRDWESDIDLRSDDGDVTIDGLRGNLRLALDDGDVDLYDCDVDSATLRLEDGDVTLHGGSGDWVLTVDDGDLELLDLAAGTVKVRAEDGDVVLGLLPSGRLDIDIRTDDGDVVLAVPSEISASFTFLVDDGTISLRADGVRVESKRAHRTTGVLGTGSGEIRVQTEDGDIALRNND